MGDIDIWTLAAAWIVVGGAAALQSTVGFGFNIVAVPLMTLLHPDLAPNPQLVITVALSAATVIRERRHLRGFQLRRIGYLLAARPVGGLIGLAIIAVATGAWLDLTIGLIVLAAVGIMATSFAVVRSPVTDALAGLASGFTSIVASIGGPPLILLYRDASGPDTRTQLGLIFAIGASISIGLRILGGAFTAQDLTIGLSMLPPMTLGFLAGGRLRSRADKRGLRTPVLALSSLAAFTLIARAISGLI